MGSEARDKLIAMVAILAGPKFGAWERGEEYVAALEAEPDKPVKCPCCTKEAVLCVKHYQLHEPGKPCVVCRSIDELIAAADEVK